MALIPLANLNFSGIEFEIQDYRTSKWQRQETNLQTSKVVSPQKDIVSSLQSGLLT